MEIGTGQGPVLYGWTTWRVWATRRRYLTVLLLRWIFTTVTTLRTCLCRVAHRLYSTVSSIPVEGDAVAETVLSQELKVRILCKVYTGVQMASRKRQTYQNKAKNLCTICV